MEILAILTFLTVAFLFLRGRYREKFEERETTSRREHLVRAGEVLDRAGYRIVDERVAHETFTFWGSRRFTAYILVDYIVEKNGVRYPSKVRSPRDPDRVSGAWLRRHLWPLYALYETPVVHVHPETGEINLVDFSVEYPPSHYRRRWAGRFVWLFVGVALGWILAAAR